MSDNNIMAVDGNVRSINGSSGSLYVPAEVQRELGVCIGTELDVTLSGFDHDFIESVSFQNPQIAGDTVTVPARIMREVGLAEADLTAEFALADDEADGSEATDEEVADSVEEVDEELEELEELVDELEADIEAEEADDEPEWDDEETVASDDDRLGELFG